MQLPPEEIARRTWQRWLESLDLHDGSFASFTNPQPGDMVLEITDGARALEMGTFLPTSLGILRSALMAGRGNDVIIEQADGTPSAWTRCQCIKVPSDLI